MIRLSIERMSRAEFFVDLRLALPDTLSMPHQEAVGGLVREALLGHPFFVGDIPPPSTIQLDVTVGMHERVTFIDHSRYPSENRVRLHIHEFHFPLDAAAMSAGEPIFLDDGALHPSLRNLLAHEFSHFIDARLDESFRYSEELRPSDSEPLVQRVHFHLWDSYIDGRLGDLAPHSLEERQREADTVDEGLINRAWAGEFSTYEAIVTQARAATA